MKAEVVDPEVFDQLVSIEQLLHQLRNLILKEFLGLGFFFVESLFELQYFPLQILLPQSLS